MLTAVADTHTALWYLYGDTALSSRAKAFIDGAASTGDQIGISSYTLLELVFQLERSRPSIATDAFSRLATALDAQSVFQEIAFDRRITRIMLGVSRAEIPDPADRIMTATALYFGIPLVTRDRKIAKSTCGVVTLW